MGSSKLSSSVSAFSQLEEPADQLTPQWSPKQTLQEACASLCLLQELRRSWIASSALPARTATPRPCSPSKKLLNLANLALSALMPTNGKNSKAQSTRNGEKG